MYVDDEIEMMRGAVGMEAESGLHPKREGTEAEARIEPVSGRDGGEMRP